jgi:glucosamine--fructose-6-phosphate aminotransferase (isomerizing)
LQEFLIQEIFEQSAIIQKLITNQFSEIQSIARHLKNKYKYIVIAARGSSDNAARYAQYVLGVFNNNQVALATPSVYTIYKKPPGLTGALVIGISQSGQSPDIVSVLESAKQQGQPTLCITNDEKSPLAMTSDYVIPIQAGKEYSVAATKTYTASLTALAMLSIGLQNDKERSGELMLLPETIDNLLPELKETADGASRYRYMEHCVVIGRGFNYSTAFEIALKVKELTRVVAVPYSSADFKHGPIATVHTGFPVIVIASSGPMYAHIKKFTGNLIKMGAEIIAISDKKEFTSLGKLSFKMPSNVPEWLSPITNVIPGQLFARKLAAEKELNVDKPEGLSKITETY